MSSVRAEAPAFGCQSAANRARAVPMQAFSDPKRMFQIRVRGLLRTTFSRRVGSCRRQVLTIIVNHALTIEPRRDEAASIDTSKAFKQARASCRMKCETAVPLPLNRTTRTGGAILSPRWAGSG